MKAICTVRQATIEDLKELSVLFDQYRVFYGQASDLHGAEQFLWEKFEHRESVIFIASHLESGKAAGFTQLYPSFSSVSMERLWTLNDLFVAPAHRGQGVAGQLLEAAGRFALHTRAKGLQLSTAIDNTTAQRLYESLGYVRDEEFYHYFLKV